MRKTIIILIFLLIFSVNAEAGYRSSISTQLTNRNLVLRHNPLSQADSYTDISAEDGKYRLENEDGIVLLDVRTPEEHLERHIPGSILIPLDIVESKAPRIIKNKETVVFVYCRSGARSVSAALKLVEMGYTNVYNLGGILNWPFETETGSSYFSDNFYESNTHGWTTYGGMWSAKEGSYRVDIGEGPDAGQGYKSISHHTEFTDFVYDADIIIEDLQVENGGAGVIFRVKEPGNGPSMYNGYYVGISAENKISFGKANAVENSWTLIKETFFDMQLNNTYHLRVVAIGPRIRVYVDDMKNPLIDEMDSSYTIGSLGLKTWQSNASWTNIEAKKIKYPNPPTELIAKAVGDDAIEVGWQKVIGANGYSIYRSLSVDGTYELVNSQPVHLTSFTDTHLEAGTEYFYKVAAVNVAGNSEMSEAVSAFTKTLPEPMFPLEITSTFINKAEGVSTQVEILPTQATNGVIIFKLMRGTIPVALVAAQNDFDMLRSYNASFPSYAGEEYWIRVLVWDQLSNSHDCVGTDLALPIEIN